MFGMFYVVFFLAIAMFIFAFARIISEWSKNNKAPRLSVDAKIVDKRSEMHYNHSKGHHYQFQSYLVTFEAQRGDRIELGVTPGEFSLLVVGDEGVLSFQGTRFLGFERKINNI